MGVVFGGQFFASLVSPTGDGGGFHGRNVQRPVDRVVLFALALQRFFSANPVRVVDAFAAFRGLGRGGEAPTLPLRVIAQLEEVFDDRLSAGSFFGGERHFTLWLVGTRNHGASAYLRDFGLGGSTKFAFVQIIECKRQPSKRYLDVSLSMLTMRSTMASGIFITCEDRLSMRSVSLVSIALTVSQEAYSSTTLSLKAFSSFSAASAFS